MSYQCPLIEASSVEFDRNGIVWEPGIPQVCQGCFGISVASNTVEVIKLRNYEVKHDDLDSGYVERGISAENNRERLHITEAGVEGADDLLSTPVTVTTSMFTCILALGIDEC